MKTLIEALECSISVHAGCDPDCPYRLIEEIKDDFPVPADEIIDGVGYWVSCDCDGMARDAIKALKEAQV